MTTEGVLFADSLCYFLQVETMLTALMKETPDLDFSDEVIRHIVEQVSCKAKPNLRRGPEALEPLSRLRFSLSSQTP